jgi:hypothetical protein
MKVSTTHMDLDCCICLLSHAETQNISTSCCNQKIHESCLIAWFIHKGEIDCPLCRSCEIEIKIDDIIKFDISSSPFLHLENRKEYMININQLITRITGHYIVNINDNIEYAYETEQLSNDSAYTFNITRMFPRSFHQMSHYLIYFILYGLLLLIIIFKGNDY